MKKVTFTDLVELTILTPYYPIVLTILRTNNHAYAAQCPHGSGLLCLVDLGRIWIVVTMFRMIWTELVGRL